MVNERTRRAAPARSRNGRWVGVTLVGLVVLIGIVYVGAYLAAGDNVPRNSTVAGVEIGGMEPDQAVSTLESQLGESAKKPITLESDHANAEILPEQAGLSLDVAATVDQAGAGRSWNPVHIWRVLTGGQEIDPVYVRDEAKVKQAVSGVASKFAIEPKDATVTLEGTDVKTTSATQGWSLDVDQTTAAILDVWPTSHQVKAAGSVKEPDVTDADVESTSKELDTALKSPIILTTDRGDIVVTPAMIASAAKVDPKGKEQKVTYDKEALWKALQPALKPLQLSPAKDVSFTLRNGAPAVVAAKPGVGVDKDELLAAAIPLIGVESDRTVKISIRESKPTMGTEMADKLGVKEVTGEFTTHFPYAEYRNHNLSKAAASINGSYVAPGETWSFNETVGERTKANGYVDGNVINGGRLVMEPGGGVSQSATTVYNAYFFAGLEDVEHHPHTLYYDRYPMGREATVYYGHLDLRFKNNTPYGVLLQADTVKAKPGGRGSITVKVWSTKQYTVKATEPVQSNFTRGTRRVVKAANCQYQAPSPGFTVTYKRQFYKGNTLAKEEPFAWTYSPADEVICG